MRDKGDNGIHILFNPPKLPEGKCENTPDGVHLKQSTQSSIIFKMRFFFFRELVPFKLFQGKKTVFFFSGFAEKKKNTN